MAKTKVTKKSKKTGSKTRVLHIYGDDYAALLVEENLGIEKAAKMVDSGESFDDFNEVNGVNVEAEILEFDKIDLKFYQFLYDSGLIDYDAAKSCNIYLLDD